MSTLCRIEYLGKDGTWHKGHAGIALVDPARYARTLRGRVGRVTVLDATLQPTDEIYVSPALDLI